MEKKYIDAELLETELKRRIKERDNMMKLGTYFSTSYVYEDILDLIDSLQQEQSSIPSNLDEAVAKYIESQTPADQGEEMIIYNAFKAGAEAIINQRVSLGYLISWYIQSVDEHSPIWTEEHLKELDKDFILIPKPLNNY